MELAEWQVLCGALGAAGKKTHWRSFVAVQTPVFHCVCHGFYCVCHFAMGSQHQAMGLGLSDSSGRAVCIPGCVQATKGENTHQADQGKPALAQM